MSPRRLATVALLALALAIGCRQPEPQRPCPDTHAESAKVNRGALQMSTSVRNALLDAIESDAGTAAILKIRSGSVPATCATADSGTVLASMTLPSDWMSAASSGSKSKTGTWSDPSADATGTAAHFRIYKSDGTTCVMQGTVTATAGGGDLTLDSTSITLGQTVTISTFTLTAPGAWIDVPTLEQLAMLLIQSRPANDHHAVIPRRKAA